ncbi:MAG: UDP-N-acetylmuramoyl-L-alanyl-D-glutamate--2,6-diaminopimelate ligase, partial [Gammaproteobacteria bacterium]|nr:UDP-N-acetylmuramoyl-L-alanyl-D-glutamate--2,6-diaminopimelate ligase [Gammaproteobacteria bacterium]
LDYHGDMESYANAKRKLFQTEGLQYAVINADDAFGQSLFKEISDAVSVVAFSLSGKVQQGVSTICVTQITLDENGIAMQVDTPWGRGELHSSLLGRFNAENLLASMTCLLVMGLPFEDVLARLARIKTVPGRMERIAGTKGPTVIVDYAHTPDALEHVLKAVREHCTGKLICVFGCGGDRDQGKRPLMGEVAARLSDSVIVTDDNPRHEDPKKIVSGILSGMNNHEPVLVEHDRAMAIRHAIEKADKHDLVLIAGKGHEDYQLIGDEKRPFSDRDYVKVLLA